MQEDDKELTRLLSQLAPPERDPVFRLEVAERRERLRFRRQMLFAIGASIGIALLLTIGARAGGLTYSIVGIVLFAVAVAVVALTLLPLIRQLFSRLGPQKILH